MEIDQQHHALHQRIRGRIQGQNEIRRRAGCGGRVDGAGVVVCIQLGGYLRRCGVISPRYRSFYTAARAHQYARHRRKRVLVNQVRPGGSVFAGGPVLAVYPVAPLYGRDGDYIALVVPDA